MPKGRAPRSTLDRLADKFTVGDGCWLWVGTTQPKGYGTFFMGSQVDGTRRMVLAHRAVYEALVGPIPDGLHLDHICRVRNCVRPDHLEPVTSRENTLRGESIPARNAAKTHCSRGHEFNTTNTYVRPDGSRQCNACRRVVRGGGRHS